MLNKTSSSLKLVKRSWKKGGNQHCVLPSARLFALPCLVTKPGNMLKPELISGDKSGWKATQNDHYQKFTAKLKGYIESSSPVSWPRFDTTLFFSLMIQINSLKIQLLDLQMNHVGMRCKHTGGKKHSKWSQQTVIWTKRAGCMAIRMKAKCSALEGIINCVNAGSIAKAWPWRMRTN